MPPTRPNRPRPGAALAPALTLAAAACLLPARRVPGDEAQPAPTIQQARARVVAGGAAAFARAPVAEAAQSAVAPAGQGRLSRTLEAARSAAMDIRVGADPRVAADSIRA